MLNENLKEMENLLLLRFDKNIYKNFNRVRETYQRVTEFFLDNKDSPTIKGILFDYNRFIFYYYEIFNKIYFSSVSNDLICDMHNVEICFWILGLECNFDKKPVKCIKMPHLIKFERDIDEINFSSLEESSVEIIKIMKNSGAVYEKEINLRSLIDNGISNFVNYNKFEKEVEVFTYE